MSKQNPEQNPKAKQITEERAVLVTTDRRGVFFGYIDAEDRMDVTVITLHRARMIVYWSEATRGILGLAATGPAAGSKVTPAVPSLTLQGVTAVGECTEAAVTKMEATPWR